MNRIKYMCVCIYLLIEDNAQVNVFSIFVDCYCLWSILKRQGQELFDVEYIKGNTSATDLKCISE